MSDGIPPQNREANGIVDLETFLDSLPDVLYILNTDLTISFLNESAREAVSYVTDTELTKADIIGTELWELNPAIKETELYERCRLAISEQEQSSYVSYNPGGESEGWTHTRVFPTDAGVIIISRDITEQKLKERELERKNTRLDNFVSIVSHDLRNPLTVAKGHLELAMDTGDLSHLDNVADAHERMNTLIDDLLSLARNDRDFESEETIDLGEFAEVCWGNVDTAHAELFIQIDNTVTADSNRLAQLFENLFRNAIEHGGDDVTVRVVETPDGFAVEDTGVGIPESKQDVIFDAGYTTVENGTGLGLDIVRRITDAFGWSIKVTESDSGGARFEITFETSELGYQE